MNLTSGLKPVFYTPVVNTNELGAEGSTLLSPGSNVGCSGCLAQGHLSTVPRFEVATLQQPIPFLWAMSCPNNAKHRKKKKNQYATKYFLWDATHMRCYFKCNFSDLNPKTLKSSNQYLNLKHCISWSSLFPPFESTLFRYWYISHNWRN